MVRLKQTAKWIKRFTLLGLVLPAAALAAQSQSSSYQVNEVFFGTGGELHACSSTFCAKQAAGETAIGNTAGTADQAQAGFNTDRQPYLEMTVTAASINLGVLASGSTTTTTSAFKVKNYLSSGYTIITASDPPANSSYTMQALSTPTASNSSAEQFGINVVRNQTTCPTPAPANFGSDPIQVPSSSFSFGSAAAGYNTCGLFKYVKGDTIASSSKSSGETDYTISYIFNISPTTPGGTYSMNHVLVAVGGF
jgi:hypothetical protein